MRRLIPRADNHAEGHVRDRCRVFRQSPFQARMTETTLRQAALPVVHGHRGNHTGQTGSHFLLCADQVPRLHAYVNDTDAKI
jgi:hypothetical protein